MGFQRSYSYYKKVFNGQSMPFAFVDMDLFRENAKNIVPRSGNKNIRIASKSIRCVELLKLTLNINDSYKGCLCYAIPEAVFLSKNGLDDLVVGYPSIQENHIANVGEEIKKGKTIVLMVDSVEQVRLINSIGEKHQCVIPVCIDLDMSSDFPGIRFGVYRSAVTNKLNALALADEIALQSNVKLDGLMGYEAQIAGLGDNVPGKIVMNGIIRFLKTRSLKEIAQRRKEVVEAIETKHGKLRFVNGGGTGSLETTALEPWVTEVAMGSGLFSSALFDNYIGFKHLPAAGFAVEAVRQPKPSIWTLHGGGYVASGAVGIDKQPVPYLPLDIQLTKNEGAGEVQTPIRYSGDEISLGDPVFFRHSKAGELCERFNSLLLVEDGKVVSQINTYRGDGQCFL